MDVLALQNYWIYMQYMFIKCGKNDVHALQNFIDLLAF